MPVINYHFRKISCADLEKSSAVLILCTKMTHFPHFRHMNFPSKSIAVPLNQFNACHQIQFQKSLMNRFCLNVDFGPKNAPFISFRA